MGMPREAIISVIVPVYKVEEYLDECVRSIIEQTYQNLEIILVDDGSPDSCPKKCDKWAERDRRIRVIHKSNGGLSSARNAGIDIASGDYLSFVDSDDFIEKDMLRTMLLAAMDNEAEVVCCGRNLVLSSTNIKPMHCLDVVKVYTKEQAMKEVLLGNEIEEAAWDKLYKAELFSGIRYPEGEINEDIVVIGPILSKCNTIVHVGVPFYNYRVNKNGITKSLYNEKKSIYIKHMEQVENFFMSNYPQLEMAVHCFLARYAYASLLDMEMGKETIRDYKSDYNKYKIILSKNYKVLFAKKDISFKTRVQILLILMNLYGPMIRIKKRIAK